MATLTMHSSIELDTRHLLAIKSSGRCPIPAMRYKKENQVSPMAINDTSKSTSSTRSALRPPWFRSFQETWILELLGLVCSAVGLFAIASILLKYDGKQQPSWSISINAVVSILSGVVSVGALYSVTHAVNQLKWVWFSEQERKLADIQMFDDGSRGVAGAMALVYHLRAQYAILHRL
jgi:hypothetical protein